MQAPQAHQVSRASGLASPLLCPSSPALPDPGGWFGAAAYLLAGPAARGLELLGLDASVYALAEVQWIEQAGVGPTSGILRRNGACSPAWAQLHRAVLHRERHQPRTGTGMALTTRVSMQLQRHGARLPASMRRRLIALHDRLAAEGVPLERLAAAHAHGSGVFITRVPVAVQGAPGWEIHMRIEPTLDGAWLVTARRTWAGIGAAPAAPAVVLTLRADEARPDNQPDSHDDHQNNGHHDQQTNRQHGQPDDQPNDQPIDQPVDLAIDQRISRRVTLQEAFALWYEDRPFSPLPRVSARSDSGP